MFTFQVVTFSGSDSENRKVCPGSQTGAFRAVCALSLYARMTLPVLALRIHT
jgi:hypothetical protein